MNQFLHILHWIKYIYCLLHIISCLTVGVLIQYATCSCFVWAFSVRVRKLTIFCYCCVLFLPLKGFTRIQHILEQFCERLAGVEFQCSSLFTIESNNIFAYKMCISYIQYTHHRSMIFIIKNKETVSQTCIHYSIIYKKAEIFNIKPDLFVSCGQFLLGIRLKSFFSKTCLFILLKIFLLTHNYIQFSTNLSAKFTLCYNRQTHYNFNNILPLLEHNKLISIKELVTNSFFKLCDKTVA